MASASKRGTDAGRGRAGKYTCYWTGADGRPRSCVGTSDHATSLKIAQANEDRATQVRKGLIDQADLDRLDHAHRPVAAHLDAYHADLKAKGDTAKHADWTRAALARLLASASVSTLAELAPDRVRAALGRMREDGSSARTVNSYRNAVRSFARWLADVDRIAEAPKGILRLGPYNEREDRRLVRRALTLDELARLLEAAEKGPPVESLRGPRKATLKQKGGPSWITGPERAAVYRLAMGTGFRASELRTLTPERFALDGDAPTVTVLACYSKNGKEAVQPVRRELADSLRDLVASRPPGAPVFAIPVRTAKMLRVDLEAAGIPFETAEGVVDFHALRSSFVTHLVNSGANIKAVQILARHSTIVLTLDRYTKANAADVRKALEGE